MMGPGEQGPHQSGGFWNGLAHAGWAVITIALALIVVGIFVTFDAGQWAAGLVGATVVVAAIALGAR
jgi:hypothetical protein